MPGRAFVGCAGWDYRDWTPHPYPPEVARRRRFDLYASVFDSVELNATFYRLPSETTIDRWRDRAPPGFRYAVKVGSYGTHRKHLRDPELWLPRHVERVERLGPSLGPNLLQLPPRWRRDAGRLDAVLAEAPSHARWAVEVRDRSWLHRSVLDVLAAHGAALCIHDLLEDHPWERTTDFAYVRFHGPDALHQPYAGRYTGRRLWRPARRLRTWLDEGADVFAYFNNDQRAAAFDDACWLADRLSNETA